LLNLAVLTRRSALGVAHRPCYISFITISLFHNIKLLKYNYRVVTAIPVTIKNMARTPSFLATPWTAPPDFVDAGAVEVAEADAVDVTLVHPDVPFDGIVALLDRVRSAHYEKVISGVQHGIMRLLAWNKLPSPPLKRIWMVTFAPS
jgi:hypothetical protein